jgi:hypothetical protein
VSERPEIGEKAHELITAVIDAVESEVKNPDWHRYVALTTLFLALLAALGAMLAGITAEEAVLERTEEILEVNRLEGDRAHIEVLQAKHEILVALDKEPDVAEVTEILEYIKEIQELTDETAESEAEVQTAVRADSIFGVAVTLLSLGITLGGTSVLVDRKFLWLIGLVFGAAGTVG